MNYLYNDSHTRPFIYDIRRTGIDFDSFTSAATYATVYEWVTKFMGKKYIRLTSATNDVTVKITGSYDGYNYDMTVQDETVIPTGTTVKLEFDAFYATLKIEAKDTVAASHGVLSVVLTATSDQPAIGDGSNATGKQFQFTYTTTGNNYAVIGTAQIAGYMSILNTLSVSTNNLLFKFEFSRDGYTWTESITDYPVTSGTVGKLSAVRTAYMYRVSVKPASAGQNGTVLWLLTCSAAQVDPDYKSAFDYEDITVTSAAAIGFTLATMADASRADVTVEGNPVRICWDGTTPTTSLGHLLQSGDYYQLDFTANLYHFRAIATGSDATLRVTYSR